MEELLAKMAGLLQEIYDEGQGGEFRDSINLLLVQYNAAKQSVQLTALRRWAGWAFVFGFILGSMFAVAIIGGN